MDGVALLKRTVDELKRVTDNVKPDQLGNPTPCSEWTVRDILNHMAGGGTMFAISAEDGSIPDDVIGKLMTEDQLGDDYKGAVHKAGDRVLAAYERPGVMDKTVTLPFGQMPAAVALEIAVFDVVTHCCDVASATGQSVDDEELLETALAKGHGFLQPAWRGPAGVFKEELTVADGASAFDKLMAFAGRKV